MVVGKQAQEAGLKGCFTSWLAGVLVACLLMWSLPSMASGTRPASPVRPDPELMLIEVYKALSQNRLREAQARADELVATFPNFRLGQLVRGDLLLLHTQPIKTFGAASNAPNEQLSALRQEAIVRLRSLHERPDPKLVPQAVLQLRADQKIVLLMDARRSRLYVYENQNGHLNLTHDYYVSQGKLGMDKFREGDQRTPIGVYYVTSHIPGPRLPDFYGPGALPINYPNEWDRVNERGGSGIWFHGTPSDSYSRPPLSSDGCIVLPNPDMIELASLAQVGLTPVVISDNLKFVTRVRADADRIAANRMLEAWRTDLESTDMQKLRRHYSTQQFKGARGQSLDNWLSRVQQANLNARQISVSLRDVTLFRYPDKKGQKEMIVTSFTQETAIGKGKHVSRKRQYWAKEGSHWRIVSESLIQ